MQMQLTPLAGYSVPCNTRTMCSIAATASGNIFLGCEDGNVFQLQYGKRQMCRLTCVSRSFLTMLGAGVLPPLLVGKIWNLIPIDTMVVDNDRHILYTLSRNHSIKVPSPPPAFPLTLHLNAAWQLSFVRFYGPQRHVAVVVDFCLPSHVSASDELLPG